MELLARDACDCAYNNFPGRYPINPEYQQTPSSDDGPTCPPACLGAYLSRTFGHDEVSNEICGQLEQDGAENTFYSLYWLDWTYCGVWNGEEGSVHLDPNVDHIINRCKNFGHNALNDSGPPPLGWTPCGICAKGQPDSTVTQGDGPLETGGGVVNGPVTVNAFSDTQSPALTEDMSIAGAKTSSFGRSAPSSSPRALFTSTSASGSASPTGQTSSNEFPANTATAAPNPALATSTSQPDDVLSASASERIPTRTIVAISVSSVLGLVAMVCLLLCALHQRRKRKTYARGLKGGISRVRGDLHKPSMAGNESPTPLISPPPSATDEGPPLTPPLRLRDRKLLPSLLQPQSGSESAFFGPPFDNQGRANFPSSPICAPTINRLEPRDEKGLKTIPYTTETTTETKPLKSPPPMTFAFPPRSSLDGYSYATSRTGSVTANSSLRKEITSTITSGSTSGTAMTATTNVPAESRLGSPTPPSSPVRPPRPHDTPLEIPDLVTPLAPTPTSPSPGPPPTRALPQPPRASLASTTGIGLALSTSPPPLSPLSPARKLGHAVHQIMSPDSVHKDSRNLEQLKEEYWRESWGSWSRGGASDGAMPVPPPRARGSAEKTAKGAAPVMSESDLERLRGRY